MGKRKSSDAHKTILDMDYEMRLAFANEKKRLPKLSKQIQKLKTDLTKPLPLGKRQNLTRQLEVLEIEHEYINSDMGLSEYIMETSDVITEYKKLLNTKQTETFVGSRKNKNVESKKMELERQYISSARLYDEFDILPTVVSQASTCSNCSGGNFEVHDDRVYICTCGAIKEIETNTGCYRDCSRTNGSSDYQYERRLHFKNAIDCYCGKQNKVPKPETCKEIIEVLYRYKIIDSLKPDTWDPVLKEHIIMAFKEINIDDYNDAQLYHTHITGKPGPDLSHIEKDLFDDHDKITEVYKSIMEEVIEESNGKWDRTSFLNGEYTLYQLLKRHGYDCSKTEFRMLKTTDPLIFHDIVYTKISKRFGWTMEKLA